MVALVLLLAAMAALAGPAAAACNNGQFQCGDGSCIEQKRECDGWQDCKDGADEGSCTGRPTTTIGVGESVTVEVDVSDEHGNLFVLVCDAGECGSVEVARDSRNASSLAFQWRAGCNWPLWRSCQRAGPQPSATKLGAGSYTLRLKRSTSQLAVFATGDPTIAGVVDVPKGGVVRVRASSHNQGLSAKFRVCGTNRFQCSDYQCISSGSVCDGLRDCQDGSDEVGCAGAPSIELGPGDAVTLQAAVQRKHSHLYVLACGEALCSSLKLGKDYLHATSSLAYKWHTGCSWPNWRTCARSGPEPSSTEMRPGTYTLRLERTATELTVYPVGKPENRGAMTVPAGSTAVRVRALAHNEDLSAVFKDFNTGSA